MENHNINILRIKAVNKLLEELSKEVVYMGGAVPHTLAVYITCKWKRTTYSSRHV